MALTVTNLKRNSVGNRRTVTATVTFDSSYPTGGESLTPTQIGLKTVDFMAAEPQGGRTFPYDHANKKLMAFASTTQVTNATDLSAVSTVVWAIGV